MAYLLLVAVQILGLGLILFGFPGLWLQVAALAGFAWLTDFRTVGWVPIAVVVVLALVAEAAELLLGGRYARRYGGGRRAEWGAAIGGMVGALMGLPLPLIGSILGAVLGSFVGAFLLEMTTGRGAASAARAGWGGLVGRAIATAMKIGIGIVILVITLSAAL